MSRSARGETVSAEVPPGVKTTSGPDFRKLAGREFEWLTGGRGLGRGRQRHASDPKRASFGAEGPERRKQATAALESHRKDAPCRCRGSLAHSRSDGPVNPRPLLRLPFSFSIPRPRDGRMGDGEPPPRFLLSAPRSGMISCAEIQCLGPAACVAHLCPSGFFLGLFGMSHRACSCSPGR